MTAHDSLESTLRQVEPALCLVPERHLRRLLRQRQGRGELIPMNPDLPWWFDREIVEETSILASGVLDNPATRLLLVTDANDRLLERRGVEERLGDYWRSLFQARVLKELLAHPLSLEEARGRLAVLGPSAVREARFVLIAEHRLHPEANDAALYSALTLAYLELEYFAPAARVDFFPGVPEPAAVHHALQLPFDGERLFRETHPPGAREPNALIPHGMEADSAGLDELPDLARAQEAAQKGNHVRAAILYARSPDMTARAREQIRLLVAALGDFCGWNEDMRQEWVLALTPLLGPAARGNWSRAARGLYELQKIPTDLRGEVFAVDMVEWIRTLGRRPICRPLPRTRNVLLMRHLRNAQKQFHRCDLEEGIHLQLEYLFHVASHATEHAIREELAPVLEKVLAESGLQPTNTVEGVAREKLVAELLDRVCERGYLRIGDLRDAIARNQLKMPDLAGPGEFFTGDPFLRADTTLAYELDGIHRRGEFYLRGLQRFSSLFFGTPWGRWLTLYIAIPFGGAFLSLMFAEELRHIGGKVGTFFTTLLAPKPSTPPPSSALDHNPETDAVWSMNEETNTLYYWNGEDWIEHVEVQQVVEGVVGSSASHGKTHGSFLIEPPTVFGFGIFLLLMLHVPPFRRAVFLVLRNLWACVRMLLIDLPLAIWRRPIVRLLRDNAIVRFVALYLGGPILLTGMFVGTLALLGAPFREIWRPGLFFLVVIAIAVNTRLGWLVQDRVAESFSDGWRLLRVNLIPGVVATILAWFKMLANWIERKLYDVDESLRFHSGDSRLSLVLKAAFGLFWFPFAYVTRFVFYLLVEPQVNPVKHFPVVTVSHKVIWPMVPQLVEWTGFSPWTVGMVVNGIPGIFGFMAWELKENWRLYRANRPATLKPVMIGSHGESMRGLLRPGFHSGTVPRTYRKLRRAWWRHRGDLVSRWHHELEHIAEAVRRFAERDLIAVLATRPEWEGHTLEVREVKLECLRLTMRIGIRDGQEVTLTFEHREGRIEARLENEQEIKSLGVERFFSLRDAATGLFNMGAAGTGLPWAWDEWVKRWERGSTV